MIEVPISTAAVLAHLSLPLRLPKLSLRDGLPASSVWGRALRASSGKLTCHHCGQRLDPGDTTIIRIAQRRFEERKHCCPNCRVVIAIEIGPNDETAPVDPDCPALDS